jgi:hypothetical protein
MAICNASYRNELVALVGSFPSLPAGYTAPGRHLLPQPVTSAVQGEPRHPVSTTRARQRQHWHAVPNASTCEAPPAMNSPCRLRTLWVSVRDLTRAIRGAVIVRLLPDRTATARPARDQAESRLVRPTFAAGTTGKYPHASGRSRMPRTARRASAPSIAARAGGRFPTGCHGWLAQPGTIAARTDYRVRQAPSIRRG